MAFMATVTEDWSERAKHYAQSPLHQHGTDLKKLLALARPTWSDICLDLGTGAGHTAAALAPYVRSVLGIDPSEGMLRQAMQTYGHLNNLEFAYGYAHDTNQASESFDLISVRHTAHHFPSLPKFLHEAARVLKPGGRMVILDEITPHIEVDDWYDGLQRLRDPSHKRAYLLREWQTYVDNSPLTWICGDERTTLSIDVASWLARGSLPRNDYPIVYEHFLMANTKERSVFHVKFEGSSATSFIMPFALILVEKPNP